jgi:hypothetical protein
VAGGDACFEMLIAGGRRFYRSRGGGRHPGEATCGA